MFVLPYTVLHSTLVFIYKHKFIINYLINLLAENSKKDSEI